MSSSPPAGSNAKGAAGVIALQLEDGTPVWQSVDDEAGYASPVMKSEWLLCWLRNQLVVCEAGKRHHHDPAASSLGHGRLGELRHAGLVRP